MNPKKKIIYLPIEIKNREYLAKSVFALYAADAGYQVCIGHTEKLLINMQHMPRGIYIGTSIATSHNEIYNKLKSYGHKIVSFDEEGLVYYNKDNFVKHRVNLGTISNLELFFTWGKNHTNLVYKKSPDIKNCRNVGNMRFEILKEKYSGYYADKVKEIKEKYGDFILINTNLGMYNNVLGKGFYYQVLNKQANNYDENDAAFYEGKYTHQKVIFDSYKKISGELAERYPGKNIIIRPHPAENFDNWMDANSKNVFVIHEGSALPWILASDVVIQKNCTTSIEATYLDKVVVTYSESFNELYDNEITNNIGVFCDTSEQVFEVIDNLESYKKNIGKDKEKLAFYAENMADDENIDLSILKELDVIDVPEVKARKGSFVSRQLIKNSVKEKLRLIKNSILKRQSSDKFNSQKFSSLEKHEFMETLKAYSDLMGIGLDEIEVKNLYTDVFYLNKK